MQTLKTLVRKAGIMMLAMLVTHTAVADTVTYFHNDISGTPLAATDASGALLWRENYKPYGEKLNQAAPSSSNKIGFHGKAYDDDTGLSYMGARYYDPMLGRFMGVDPVDFHEDNLHSFNRYTYVNSNPYKYVDPNGEYAFLIMPLVSLLTALSVTAVATSTSSSVGSGGDQGFSESGGMTTPGSNIDSSSSWSLGNVFQDDSKDAEIQDQADDDGASIPEAPVGEARVRDDNWFKNRGIDAHAEKAGMGDSRRNLAVDKKDNVWTVDRHGSGNPEYVGRLKDLRKDQ